MAKNDLDEARKIHEELENNAEEILQELKLPYRQLLMCTGDMGEPQRGVPLIEKAMEVAERQGKQRQLNEARELLSQLSNHGDR